MLLGGIISLGALKPNPVSVPYGPAGLMLLSTSTVNFSELLVISEKVNVNFVVTLGTDPEPVLILTGVKI